LPAANPGWSWQFDAVLLLLLIGDTVLLLRSIGNAVLLLLLLLMGDVVLLCWLRAARVEMNICR
jgi:hypothetical protein